METSNVNILKNLKTTDTLFKAHYGELEVLSRVIGFKKAKFHTLENLGFEMLDMPQRSLLTSGFWITFPLDIVFDLLAPEEDKLIYALKGVLTAVGSVASVLLMSDPGDLGRSITGGGGGESLDVDFMDTRQQQEILRREGEEATLNMFVFDRYPGGIGLSEQLLEMYPRLISSSIKLIRECDCKSGCPSCTGPMEHESPAIKSNALKILSAVESVFQ